MASSNDGAGRVRDVTLSLKISSGTPASSCGNRQVFIF
jgi:hypothetical protein